MLHIVYKAGRVSLFVTDYTEHPRFSYSCDQDWSQGLEGRVVPIQLRDNQVQNAKSLKENGGKFLAIKNLRLVPAEDSIMLEGELGGYDLLLNLLQPDSPNQDLQALHKYVSGLSTSSLLIVVARRKKDFQHEKEKEGKLQLQLHGQAGEPDALQVDTRTNLKIAQVEATTKDYLKARLIVRVVDYYPRSPKNWVRLWCCQCKQR